MQIGNIHIDFSKPKIEPEVNEMVVNRNFSFNKKRDFTNLSSWGGSIYQLFICVEAKDCDNTFLDDVLKYFGHNKDKKTCWKYIKNITEEEYEARKSYYFRNFYTYEKDGRLIYGKKID